MGQKKLSTHAVNSRKACSPLQMAVSYAILGLSFNAMSNIAIAEETAIELQQIDVVAPTESDTRPVKGYQAKKSTSATRTNTLLRDVSQSISVVTQELIQDQSMQSVADAVRYVPGVIAVQGEGNRDQLVFRGNDTKGDLFVDGLRDDGEIYRDFYNTDRVEVLKGPNGMIFGRGGAGGVINRVSKQAGWDPISQIIASYGAFDQQRIAADFGQAITEDIAFRINAVYENSGSYRDGVNLERYGVTPTVTIKPGENTKIVFSAEYFYDSRIGDRGVPAQATLGSPTASNPDLKRRPFNIGDHSSFFGSANLSHNKAETIAFSSIIEHLFDNGIGVKNSTRYANYNKYYQNVFAGSPVSTTGNFNAVGYRAGNDRENLINQTDLTYSANWGSVQHKLLAGLELTTQKSQDTRLAAFFNNDFTAAGLQTSLNANNQTQIGNIPAVFRANLLNNNNAFRNNYSTVDVIGFYMQDQIILSPQWQAIIGLRHDKVSTRFDGVKPNFSGGTVSESFDVSDNLLSPRAGLIFKPIEPVSIYTNYSLSYVPRAGDQLTGLNATNFSAAPEKFINYELGAKWDVNPNLAVTAAVYKLERQNVGIADPNNANGQILLVDGQETKGLELGVAGNITNKWSVFGGYAYQDGEITKTLQNSTINNVIAKGSELAQTPKHTFSVWNRYDINPTWGVALGVISRSDMYAALPTLSQSTILPGYTRLDAAIYANINKKTRLQINLENLTNKEYALFAHNNQNITPGSPISGRATLVYNF